MGMVYRILGPMIFHIVLFDPKPDLTATDHEAFSRALERALRDIPSIREARVGRRVRHGAGYEAGMRESFEYAAVIGFESLEGLREYLEHPAHRELGARFNASAARMLVYDYDMGK
jgi:hypothetical protein